MSGFRPLKRPSQGQNNKPHQQQSQSRTLSAREAEVLERQRRLAAQLTGLNPSAVSSSSSAAAPATTAASQKTQQRLSSTTAPSSTSSSSASQSAGMSNQQRLLMKANQRKRLDEIFHSTKDNVTRPSPSRASSAGLARPKSGGASAAAAAAAATTTSTAAVAAAKQKRPAMRPKPGTAAAREAVLTKPASAAAALAAARSRLGIKPEKKEDLSTSTTPHESSSVSSAVTGGLLKRPLTRNKSTSVAGILSAVGADADALKSKYERHYPKVEPDDFWRDVREWDFLADLNTYVQSQKRRDKKNNRETEKKRQGEHVVISEQPLSSLQQRRQSGRGYETQDGDGGGGGIQRGCTPPLPTPPSTGPPDKVESASSNDVHKSSPLMNDKKAGISHDSSRNKNDDNVTPLPTVFDSHRQYMALWAPLCLAEAHAQLLSEVSSGVPYWSKPGKGPIPISVQPLKKDVGGSSDFITVQIKAKSAAATNSWGANASDDISSSGGGFYANDIILLASDLNAIISASRGKSLGDDGKKKNKGTGKKSLSLLPASSPKDRKRMGLLGHTEHSRRTVDGLLLKVSRRLWTAVGTQDMFLMKLGGNVTALREFTALCRVEQIPLLNYLLGQKLAHVAKRKESVDNGGSDAGTDSHPKGELSDDPVNKADMLDSMGGVSALGKGFTKYAQKKFNPSQLRAISAAASEYGEGGFTLVKGPPGTGKTTTLVALLNSLHIRQFNKYYEEVRRIATTETVAGKRAAFENAAKAKPRLLVCAPSNAAVDNVILKIMEDGFVDGNGCRYNPSIVRVGVGQSSAVKDVALEEKVESLLADGRDIAKLEASINGYKMELQRVQGDILRLQRRVQALAKASRYPLGKDWEIRIDEETFEQTGRVYFVNHKEKMTTFEVPPPPEPGEKHFPATSMPEYRSHASNVVKLVERYNSITSKLDRYNLVHNFAESLASGGNSQATANVRQQLETHIVESVHIVMTTLGSAGSRALESASKFEVVVVDEAAQCVEPSTLVALQLGSPHAILVGDPQQLPATIFSVSGRNTKYDRSLFQRLEEAGHEVHLLNIQYRMHPIISDFPRRIFYDGNLLDGPNVKHPEYGCPLRRAVLTKIASFQPFTVLDLDSSEERGGTSLSNFAEAQLALHLYTSLSKETGGLSSQSRVAVITPYSQQAALLRRVFSQQLGPDYAHSVEVNTVDAFQGREANMVIFSCVRAAGSRGIGFLSAVRRMNVALTRAKHFLFVIARCKSIVVNPYWRDLVTHARETNAIVPVPILGPINGNIEKTFPDLKTLKALPPPAKAILPFKRKRSMDSSNNENEMSSDEEGEISS